MRRILAVLLVAMMALSFAACGGGAGGTNGGESGTLGGGKGGFRIITEKIVVDADAYERYQAESYHMEYTFARDDVLEEGILLSEDDVYIFKKGVSKEEKQEIAERLQRNYDRNYNDWSDPVIVEADSNELRIIFDKKRDNRTFDDVIESLEKDGVAYTVKGNLSSATTAESNFLRIITQEMVGDEFDAVLEDVSLEESYRVEFLFEKDDVLEEGFIWRQSYVFTFRKGISEAEKQSAMERYGGDYSQKARIVGNELHIIYDKKTSRSTFVSVTDGLEEAGIAYTVKGKPFAAVTTQPAVDTSEYQKLLDAFFKAVEKADVDAILALTVPKATMDVLNAESVAKLKRNTVRLLESYGAWLEDTKGYKITGTERPQGEGFIGYAQSIAEIFSSLIFDDEFGSLFNAADTSAIRSVEAGDIKEIVVIEVEFNENNLEYAAGDGVYTFAEIQGKWYAILNPFDFGFAWYF